ncbi:uncharacterized protein A4U43_C05F29350 [Asparagus officinalis]|uniref:Protein kinase domain-containing protein n=1 Tax=Asparagus officinalis TaxID=4686 RepID=A0A5P1EVG3_ASPOF|nr:lysM domain receptor-like kinase 3 [Asparagus officinalis]ONK70016.1 uncharacterized protein A4U43_C05F29350 [Asparagus officinalis]
MIHPDFLVQVPCGCEDTGTGTIAYFHNTKYRVQRDDTPTEITTKVFNGLAWNVTSILQPEQVITINLLCGCYDGNDQAEVVSYTVQQGDTLSTISSLLSADWGKIVRMNGEILKNPEFLIPGWVLFVPMGTAVAAPNPKGKKHNIALIMGISISMAFLIIGGLLLFLCRRRQSRQQKIEEANKVERNASIMSIAALESQYHPANNMKGFGPTNTERPIIFSLKDVEEATTSFDEKRKIGEGGFGSVFHGILAKQEVAIKKMRSSKSKEFFAELKVLCRIHHINVVELIGYASGDDHLYLVYEYVQNGSLSDHLHDPLLKGHQPLSWNARAQIALDAARGIEYIHDHTKAQYVHRDIKTSNILLDEGLRAKVADFGLVKLVERSNEEDCMATRLVGTPGYLPPESVRELQMTSKSDVFAFGVVLAELITGCRALVRDNKEPSKMKSLISIMNRIFLEEDPETELEAIIDRNLRENYPVEEVYKMAEISLWCLDEDPVNRPEMREITVKLAQIVMASIEWEASLAGNSQVFSGIFNGR